MGRRSNIMLCYPFEERRLTEPKFRWSWPVIVQPKLDGERCRLVISDLNNILLFSSECNLFTSIPHIEEEAKKIFEYTGPIELDGELYHHGWSFEEIHSVVSRTKNLHPNYSDIKFHIFDVVSEERMVVRLGRMIDLSTKLPSHFSVVPSHMAHSLNDVLTHYDSFVDNDYEGIIVREPYSFYKRARSNKILKFKPKKEDWYKVVEIFEAIGKFGVPKKMVGGFYCKGTDGTVFKVGAGRMPHEDRKEVWKYREDFIGRNIVVQYQHTTGKGKPRFGLFVDFVPIVEEVLNV